MATSSRIAATFSLILSTALGTSASLAHHSFAMFDTTRHVELDAVVQDFQWTNPHCWVDVVAVEKGGGSSKWALEAQSPAMMHRKGWTRERLTPGDKIKVSVFPARDGSRSGALRSATLSDGSVLWAYGSADH
jgi:hypothetical protein